MIFKLLVFLVVLFFVYIIFFKKTKEKNDEVTDIMVECPKCKTFVSKDHQLISKSSSIKFLIQLSIKNTFGIFVSSHLIFQENGFINFITNVFSSKNNHSFTVFIAIHTVEANSLIFNKFQL